MSVDLPTVVERADLDELLQQHHTGVLIIVHLCADEVNREYGRAAGDAVLGSFALMLTQALSPSAVSARTGGQQFLVILPEDDVESTAEMLTRLHDLWDRRTPHACSFLACATQITSSGRTAYQLVARARPRQITDPIVYGPTGQAAVVEPTSEELTAIVAALRSFLRAESRDQIERAFRVAAVTLAGGYLDVDALGTDSPDAPPGLTADLIARLRADADLAIGLIESRARPRTRRPSTTVSR